MPSILASARIRPANPLAAIRPGVHVLAEQHDLARAAVDQGLGLGDDVVPRPRNLGTAGVGHDAISAELVAALLDGQVSTGVCSPTRWKGVELTDRRHVGVDGTDAARDLRDHFRKPVVSLRPNDDVDQRRAALGLGAFGLGDATGERDQRLRAVFPPQAPDIRIGLLGGLLANVTGVEDDEVGIVGFRSRG